MPVICKLVQFVICIFRACSSVVEHPAHNRLVAGSIPARPTNLRSLLSLGNYGGTQANKFEINHKNKMRRLPSVVISTERRMRAVLLIIILYYVYILLLSNNQYYVGFSEDLQIRIKEHNEGKYKTIKKYCL